VTHKERLALLNEWYERSLARELAEDDFCRLLGVEDLERCPTLLAGWRLHEEYTKSAAALVGDRWGWLNWWWYDAKRGTGTCEAKASAWDETKPIRTVEDLCELIEIENNGN